MVMNCQDVWREISNYLDNDLDPVTREHLEQHLAHCRHCSVLLDSTHHVITLIADERTFRLPAGFSTRLQARLERELALE